MNAIDFEYAIKKDVKNNPIVREVDRERQREFGWALVVGLGVLGVVLLLAYQQFWLSSVQAENAQMRVQIEREDGLRRRLKLEAATLANPERVQRRATEQLHMIEPPPQQVIVLERTETSPLPKTVVASR
ncbi:MAG: cell division protein FtsL [Vicinamibacterales bacterium]